MWAATLIPPAPFRCSTPAALRPYLRTQSRSPAPKPCGVYDQSVGDFGHVVLSNLNSGSSSPIQDEEEDEKQLSGADVLWALQRAAAKKTKKKNKKKKKLSSAVTDSRREDDDVDYTNLEVKPLRIKGEWAVKLDELEKRLQELSEFT